MYLHLVLKCLQTNHVLTYNDILCRTVQKLTFQKCLHYVYGISFAILICCYVQQIHLAW
jgi:hypothetical protein